MHHTTGGVVEYRLAIHPIPQLKGFCLMANVMISIRISAKFITEICKKT